MLARPERPGGPVEVVIADKNPLVLNGLKRLIARDDRLVLSITATDGERFLETLDRMAFDVGVIGWDMPYASGFEVLEALRARPDAPRIVVYTGSAAPNLAREAMALGAAGFCSKRQSPERLIETIIAVARGAMVFPFFDVRTDRTDPFGDLTPRERELLAALPSGRTNAQIAKDLGLSVNTVKFHLKSLYDKLSVRNRAQAVALHLQRPAGCHDKPDRR